MARPGFAGYGQDSDGRRTTVMNSPAGSGLEEIIMRLFITDASGVAGSVPRELDTAEHAVVGPGRSDRAEAVASLQRIGTGRGNRSEPADQQTALDRATA